MDAILSAPPNRKWMQFPAPTRPNRLNFNQNRLDMEGGDNKNPNEIL